MGSYHSCESHQGSPTPLHPAKDIINYVYESEAEQGLENLICSKPCEIYGAWSCAIALFNASGATLLGSQSNVVLKHIPSRIEQVQTFTISLGNNTWHCSAEQLSSMSDYFNRLINGPFKESDERRAELCDDAVIAAQCMMQFLCSDRSRGPPSYDVPYELGHYYSLANAVLHAQVFALGEKYLIPSLRELALSRFMKATRPSSELSDLFGVLCPFSTWTKREQLCLMHVVYCGSETADLALRNELVRAITNMTLKATQHTLSQRLGYPSVQYHLVTGISLLQGRDIMTTASMLSACGSDQEILAIFTDDPTATAESPLSWMHFLSPKSTLKAMALRCVSEEGDYKSWVGGAYLKLWGDPTVDEYKMLSTWVEAKHLGVTLQEAREELMETKNQLAHVRDQAEQNQFKIDDLSNRLASLAPSKSQCERLKKELTDIVPECDKLGMDPRCFGAARAAVVATGTKLATQSADLETSLKQAKQDKDENEVTLGIWERAVPREEREIQRLEASYELYSIPTAKLLRTQKATL